MHSYCMITIQMILLLQAKEFIESRCQNRPLCVTIIAIDNNLASVIVHDAEDKSISLNQLLVSEGFAKSLASEDSLAGMQVGVKELNLIAPSPPLPLSVCCRCLMLWLCKIIH